MENKGKAPPPARVTQEKMDRAVEMIALIDALPNSKEKEAIMKSEQWAEWNYTVDSCHIKKYKKFLTQDERRKGVAIEDGKEIKLWKKGVYCFHCNCSTQEYKRHCKSIKHQANVKKGFKTKASLMITSHITTHFTEKFEQRVSSCVNNGVYKLPLLPPRVLKGEPADEEQNRVFHEKRLAKKKLPHHSQQPPPPPPSVVPKKKKIRRKINIVA